MTHTFPLPLLSTDRILASELMHLHSEIISEAPDLSPHEVWMALHYIALPF